MEEQLISFETAKLAKEKGFDLKVDLEALYSFQFITDNSLVSDYWYNKEGGLCRLEYPKDDDLSNYINKDNYKEIYLAPTQSLLQKWLREQHNIIVIVDLDATTTPKYYYDIYKYEYIAEYTTYPGICTPLYTTYEEALEVALQEALKLI
jgi:hypothetical protein